MSKTSKSELFNNIDNNNLNTVFELLKKSPNFKGYQNFSNEFMRDNPKGTDLSKFRDRLKIFINEKYDKISLEQQEELCIVILTSTSKNWTTLKSTIKKNIPLERYGEVAENWKPFKKESIKALLDAFVKTSEIPIERYYHSTDQIDLNLRQTLKKASARIILITDAFSFHHEDLKDIVRSFDNTDKESVGGCIIPLCTTLTKKQTSFAQDLINKTFKDLASCWLNEFCKSYTHIELDVPTKNHFFRRLANIAFFKGKNEKETIASLGNFDPKYLNTMGLSAKSY